MTSPVMRSICSSSPSKVIPTAVRLSSAWLISTDYRGCGFINTHAESSELTDDHRRIVRDHKAALARYLGSILTQGDAVAVVVDGAIVQAAIFRSTEPIDLARRAARALVASDHQASANPV